MPPPPPPPVFEDDSPRSKGALQRVLALDTMGTGTSKSTASAASFTLASNASILSSQTDESEEEGGRRKVPVGVLSFSDFEIVIRGNGEL